MANNFRKIGDAYFAENGHDSGAGTADDPKKSISQMVSTAGGNVIGAGVFKGFNIGGAGTTYKIYADGKVIFDNINFTTTSATIKELNGVIWKNSTTVYIRETSSAVFLNNIFDNCTLIPSISSSAVGQGIYKSCVFDSGTYFLGIIAGVIINCTGNIYYLKDSYTDEDTIFLYVGTNSNFQANNYRGIVRLTTSTGTQDYAIKDQYTGTPQDAGYPAGVHWLNEANLTTDGYDGTVAGWDAAVATCMNREPKFNKDSIGDYSLQADSPHIGKASDGISNIGGTETGTTVLVTDDGVGDIEVITSPEIDTSVSNSFKLLSGEVEGYVDFKFKVASIATKIGKIDILSAFNFDSDFAGGSIENNNVPDSEPLTSEYPAQLTTTAAAADALTLVVDNHGRSVGEWVRVLGEDREITAVPDVNTITVGTAFRAAVGSGVKFDVGTQAQLQALRPNRLTYQLRTSKKTTKPTADGDWDNDVDPVYGVAGLFLTQEIEVQPLYYIDANNNVYGTGDSDRPSGLAENEISAIWCHARIYIRNNFRS